jgi:hypothetical protein
MRVTLALLVAALVASPALPSSAGEGTLFLTVLGVAGLCWTLTRGAEGGAVRVAVVVGGLVAVLALLSVSHGLAAADLPGWVVAVPAALGFLVALPVARGLEGRTGS